MNHRSLTEWYYIIVNFPTECNATFCVSLIKIEGWQSTVNCPSQETEVTSTPTRPVDNVVITTKGLQDRNINILDGTTVENKGKLILPPYAWWQRCVISIIFLGYFITHMHFICQKHNTVFFLLLRVLRFLATSTGK